MGRFSLALRFSPRRRKILQYSTLSDAYVFLSYERLHECLGIYEDFYLRDLIQAIHERLFELRLYRLLREPTEYLLEDIIVQ
jgi:hypothetical protein